MRALQDMCKSIQTPIILSGLPREISLHRLTLAGCSALSPGMQTSHRSTMILGPGSGGPDARGLRYVQGVRNSKFVAQAT